MEKVKEFMALFLTKKLFKKIISYLILVFLFVLFKDFLGMFFLIFIFAYLFYSLGYFLKYYLDKAFDKLFLSGSLKFFFKKIFSFNVIIILEYIIFTAIIIIVFANLIPKLINELGELAKTIPFVADQLSTISARLEEVKMLNNQIGLGVSEIMNSNDIGIVKSIWDKIHSFGAVFLQGILAFILSFVFIIDRQKLNSYLLGIKKSSFGFLYKEYAVIFDKVVRSFGLIFKAQSMIAFINAFLTIIGLVVIGFFHYGSFPYTLTLGLIVFICGFIPVLGVFISSIPILFVAFSLIGGLSTMVEVVLLISIVHIIEAYYLNPKIVSRFFEIPVSLTFIILIFSEHVFGVAGLIIGVSFFYFIVSFFTDLNKLVSKKIKIMKERNIVSSNGEDKNDGFVPPEDTSL